MMKSLSALFLLTFFTQAGFAAGKVEFNRDIRPILSDTCFHCHGPDEKERKGGLRLDVRADALKPAKSDAIAIVPGKPEASELIARVLAEDEDDLMPPTKLHKPLTAQQKALLKQWVAEGAEYQGHWAFITPVRPEIPVISDKSKVIGEASALNTDHLPLHPVDAFVIDRLNREKLALSPEADKATLIRRVSLDLIGLPPTPSEVDAFLKDASPQAYERVVDRLLSSKSYGEVMAMQWLDYARYADSHGFQTDSSRGMWPWRDWVINAFNDNKPFDQFTVEQIAGDLLPNATRDQIVATGFNRNHRLNGEGGIINEEWRIENIIDRVETTSFTWMGLTMNCCRCHDHKYDPLTQRDFYSMFAFFNNITESGTIQGTSNRSGGNSPPTIDVPSPEQETQLVKLKEVLTQAESKVAAAAKDLPALLETWEATALNAAQVELNTWHMIEPTKVESQGGAEIIKKEDGSYLVAGNNPPSDVYTITAKIPASDKLSAILLECLPDDSLANKSLGRASNGNFVLSTMEVSVSEPKTSKPRMLKLAKAEASYSQKNYDISNVLKPGKTKGWAVDGPTRHEATSAMFVFDQAAALPAGAVVTITLKHAKDFGQHNIGRFRLSSSSVDPKLVRLDGASPMAAVMAILKTPAKTRSAAQKSQLISFYRTSVDSPVKKADEELATTKKVLTDFEMNIPTVMIMKEADKPRDAFILHRGEYDKPEAQVTMATPAVLPPMPQGAPLNRLGLARWLVDEKNPLTSRVWVNRIWGKFFGYGLCKTTENLGSQSEWPSHPELLDWLATEFIRMKWDMKAFQKMLVMSEAYRQASKVTKEMVERDPDNRLLARGPRFRLSGEAVRDQALSVSGLLVPTIGGPSVKPYMPEGVWDETSKYGDLRGYKRATDAGLYRRSLYTIWKRTAAPPTMVLFDVPTREICTVKRSRTNTPLQALALLNEVTFVEASRALAEKMLKEGGTTPEERLTYGYKCATARELDEPGRKTLLKGLNDRLAFYKDRPEDAQKLITQGDSKPDATLNAVELAAYTTSASVLLNLDRVVTRD
ncbi:PSD1 and planctomycete cytochrome C domain-containing protein [soil metagenome]